MLLAQQLLNGVLASGIYALFAVGFTMIFGIMGVLNMAQADFAMVAAFTIIWASTLLGAGALPAVLLAALVVSGLAILLDRLVIRPSRRFGGEASIELPLIGTIGAGLILQNVAALLFGNKAMVFSFQMRDFVPVGGLLVSRGLLVSAVVAIVLLITLEWVVGRTDFGRQVRAVAQNPDAAKAMGINTNQVIALTTVMTAILAGVGGLLAGLSYGLIAPLMGVTYALKGLVAMIVGGVGSLRGAALGALLIGIVEALAVTWYGSQLRDLSVFLVLLAVLVIRPRGLFHVPGVS
jgi:branched-chain amino acid transport system permease protein